MRFADMPNWKILITDGLKDNGKEILMARAQVADQSGIQPDQLLQIAPEYDALIVRGRTEVDGRLINSAEQLKVIGRAGVGVDNIDLNSAKLKGIRVVNSPTASSRSVAELTIGFLFALARSLPFASSQMKSGLWPKKQLHGIELYGKTIGIIGVGNIGFLVARIAAGLGMVVLGCDNCKPISQIEDSGAEATSLNEVYSRSNFLTFHIPLNGDTRGMIDRDAIAQMKSGVYIVNTSRGGIVDESALLEGLNSGQIAGAALDVFSHEPPGTNELVTHPNVIVTPHIGAQTRAASMRVAEDIAVEVLAALEGKPLRWEIT
jgi:D-3-phosphoglycerate dehydrogenase